MRKNPFTPDQRNRFSQAARDYADKLHVAADAVEGNDTLLIVTALINLAAENVRFNDALDELDKEGVGRR